MQPTDNKTYLAFLADIVLR